MWRRPALAQKASRTGKDESQEQRQGQRGPQGEFPATAQFAPDQRKGSTAQTSHDEIERGRPKAQPEPGNGQQLHIANAVQEFGCSSD